MTAPRRPGGPVLLGELLDQALQRMQVEPATPPEKAAPPLPPSDGFIFSGNRHDSVPRALLLDRRLTPLERNAWQVFRLLLNDDGITAFPTYDQLCPYLASMPCAAKASHETVARALTLLRLTRWVSLVRRRRDARTGRMLGNLYVLHDEPLTPYEGIQLDPDYLGLVSHALDHASKSIQRVGVHTLKEMAEDPMLNGRILPSRLQVLTQRLAAQGWGETIGYPQAGDSHDSEDGSSGLLRNRKPPGSDSEVGQKARQTGTLRNPNEDRTVRKEEIEKEIRTVPRTRGALLLPERFKALKSEQQNGALAALQSVDPALHQAVLEEWDARCRESTVRNPAGYLFALIQRALRGDFKAWAASKAPPAPTAPTAAEPAPSRPADPEVARAHIAKIRALLRMP